MPVLIRVRDLILGERSAEGAFRQNKLGLALLIMSVGMAAALGWAAIQGQLFGRGYPYNTILMIPVIRYGDLSDLSLIAGLSNPYLDPTAFYLPLQWLCMRLLGWLPLGVQVAAVFWPSLGVLFLLLEFVLRPWLQGPVRRACLALVLLLLAYPVLFCFDRANVEIIPVTLMTVAIFLLSRAQFVGAAILLTLAASLKFPPALFLVLLVRQCRPGLAALSLFAVAGISLVTLATLSCPVTEAWSLYSRNLTFYLDFCVLQNYTLEGTASLWNAFKVIVIAAGNVGLISPVDFTYHDRFVRASFGIYSFLMALLGVGVFVYVCFLERRLFRAVIVLLLFLSVDAPSGGDYRLLYAGVALALLIAEEVRRDFDFTVVILLALTMAPKKEIFLPFAGRTETSFADVSIQVVLNPLFVLTAIVLLLLGGRHCFDLTWTRRRLNRLIRSFTSIRATARHGSCVR